MLPANLTPESFSGYPPEAKRFAQSRLPLLQRLPLSLTPLVLKEIVILDWKFPVERIDLTRQFDYLDRLSPPEFQSAMSSFSRLKLSPELEKTDWVNSPATFSEQLTAHLWATHQIEAFRAAAVDYVRNTGSGAAEPSLPTHRLGIAVIGQGVAKSEYPLFQKLKPQGVHFMRVQHDSGLNILLEAAQRRASAHPVPYGHWLIDGGATTRAGAGISEISYAALSPARAALQKRMQATYERGVFDPEAFRSMLARTGPEEIGLDAGGDPLLNRFQLSLLTEGSGTQVFATTFVQWAAREVLRRAQPLTLFVRFAPRQREKPMNELLAEAGGAPELDPRGSLVDADMGAYYTWLNQQRLPGADQSKFIVWFEDHAEAVVIAPSFKGGARVDDPVKLEELIAKIA